MNLRQTATLIISDQLTPFQKSKLYIAKITYKNDCLEKVLYVPSVNLKISSTKYEYMGRGIFSVRLSPRIESIS